MPTSLLVYYGLMILAFFVSIPAGRQDRRLKLLTLLLFFSIVTELVVELCKYYNISHRFIYHIYIPLEYLMLCLFIQTQYVSKIIKRMVLATIPLYVFLAAFFSLFILPPPYFPSIQFNIAGLFIILLVITVLFNLKIKDNYSIFRLPFFWIAIGLLLFHSGLFLFNGVYNFLLKTKSDSAAHLQKIVNTNLNYLLYLFWITGFLCSIRNRKYTIQ